MVRSTKFSLDGGAYHQNGGAEARHPARWRRFIAIAITMPPQRGGGLPLTNCTECSYDTQ